jgi:hypothetical protein
VGLHPIGAAAIPSPTLKTMADKPIPKNSVDFRPANSRTTQMLSRFYPNRPALSLTNATVMGSGVFLD